MRGAVRALAIVVVCKCIALCHAFDAKPLREFAITGVRVARGGTRNEGVDRCIQSPQWQVAGRDLNRGASEFQYLCYQKQLMESIPDDTLVLTSILLAENSKACPQSMDLIYEPRLNVRLCGQYVAKNSVIGRQYVSDLMTTDEREYNNEKPGWITLPTSASVTNNPVFISYQTPVLSIVDVKSTQAKDCANQKGYKIISLVLNNEVLCGQFQPLEQSLGANVLVGIQFITSTQSCSVDSFTTKLQTSIGAFCLSWNRGSSVSDKYIAEVFVAPNVMSGNAWIQVPNQTNTLKLYYRYYTTQEPSYDIQPINLSGRLLNDSTTLQFKILQLADMHYSGFADTKCNQPPQDVKSCSELTMTRFIIALLDAEMPDLVVFTGDNTQSRISKKAIEIYTEAVIARKIPWAVVFGNHDAADGDLEREQLLREVQMLPYSVSLHGPNNVDGVGNYFIHVNSPQVTNDIDPTAASTKLRLYFLDSHDYPNKSKYPLTKSGYDWMKPSQIEFYQTVSKKFTDRSIPAIMFFHIPLLEYRHVSDNQRTGDKNEDESPSTINPGFFSALVQMGDVKATIVGHDHVNEYCATREGIKLCYGGGVGFGVAYGSSKISRRARTIQWEFNTITQQHRITSWKRLFNQVLTPVHLETLYES